MYCKTYYDENRDKGVAVPGLAQDLSDVMETGIIKDTGLELEYNMLDEGDIDGRPEDVFQAIEYARKKAISQASRETPQVLNNQPVPGSVTPGVGEGA